MVASSGQRCGAVFSQIKTFRSEPGRHLRDDDAMSLGNREGLSGARSPPGRSPPLHEHVFLMCFKESTLRGSSRPESRIAPEELLRGFRKTDIRSFKTVFMHNTETVSVFMGSVSLK